MRSEACGHESIGAHKIRWVARSFADANPIPREPRTRPRPLIPAFDPSSPSFSRDPRKISSRDSRPCRPTRAGDVGSHRLFETLVRQSLTAGRRQCATRRRLSGARGRAAELRSVSTFVMTPISHCAGVFSPTTMCPPWKVGFSMSENKVLPQGNCRGAYRAPDDPSPGGLVEPARDACYPDPPGSSAEAHIAMSKMLEGKVAMVTGSGRGIGRFPGGRASPCPPR